MTDARRENSPATFSASIMHPRIFALRLTDANDGHIGGLADAVLLYCFCYDPATGKYGLAITRLLKIGGVLTLCSL